MLRIEDEREIDLRQIRTIPIIAVFEERDELGVTGQTGDVIDQDRVSTDAPGKRRHKCIRNTAFTNLGEEFTDPLAGEREVAIRQEE